MFGHLSMGDRSNYGSSESRYMHVVAHKREQQTAKLERRLSSLEPRVSITHELCRSPHTSGH
jgi:hypothetical protein